MPETSCTATFSAAAEGNLPCRSGFSSLVEAQQQRDRAEHHQRDRPRAQPRYEQRPSHLTSLSPDAETQ